MWESIRITGKLTSSRTGPFERSKAASLSFTKPKIKLTKQLKNQKKRRSGFFTNYAYIETEIARKLSKVIRRKIKTILQTNTESNEIPIFGSANWEARIEAYNEVFEKELGVGFQFLGGIRFCESQGDC